MSKRQTNFTQNSYYSNREENAKPKQWRSGASNGSHDMADGLATDLTEVQKHRIITQVGILHKEGKIADKVTCPYCDVSLSTINFATHVRRKH